MASKAEIITHRLINKERLKRGRGWAKWDQHLYELAKGQANKMARAGSVFHSDKQHVEGGECVFGGNGAQSPRDFVKAWLGSPRHRALILGLSVRLAAVGITRSRKGTYAAWSFSN